MLSDVVYDALASFEAEVYVEIGKRDTLWIEEPLEQQVVLDGIYVGDVDAVCDHGSGSGSASGSDRNPVGLGPVDVVAHYQVVAVEAHLQDDAKLVVEPVLQDLLLLRIALVAGVSAPKSFPGQGGQVFLGVLVLRRDVDAGKKRSGEIYVETAARGKLDGV